MIPDRVSIGDAKLGSTRQLYLSMVRRQPIILDAPKP